MTIDANAIKANASAGAASLDDVYTAIKEGPRSVMLWVLENHRVATKKEVDTDKEEMYLYADGFYSRGEEILRRAVYERYIQQWNRAKQVIDELWKIVNKSDSAAVEKLADLTGALEDMLKKGPSKTKIDETLAQLRLQTFKDPSEFNPPTHIPFQNGLLRLADWTLVDHTPNLIYLWRVEAKLIRENMQSASLNDCPMYKKFLLQSYEPWDIPMLLQYGGYAFYPAFPRQMTLWNVGRPRVGKGTNARIWRLLNPSGYGALSFEKLMIAENKFPYQSIEGKNLLVDAEVKRTFKKGARLDYAAFNKLFGGDILDLEKKGETPTDYVSRAKGLFLANLPLPRVDDEPLLSRILLIKSKDYVIPKKDLIPGLEEKIISSERDQIATLFIRYLRVLNDRNWNFISELSTDATMEIWELFSNIVQFYMEENIEYEEGSEIKCDDMYQSFQEWCQEKGVPSMKSQPFKKSVGFVYTKALRGPKKNRYYAFTNCTFAETTELEVEHHINSQKNRNIRALYCKYRGCSTWEDISRHEEKKIFSSKKIAPMLNTDFLASEKPIDKGQQENNQVFNLKQEPREQPYTILRDFAESGLLYRLGGIYRWDFGSALVQKWLREGKIAATVEPDPIPLDQAKSNLEKPFTGGDSA